MDQVLNLYKAAGETPLERLNRLREADPRYKDAVLTYAGRLDPLAEGVMLVLAGEENKRRGEYLGLDKEYSFDVLFGVQTDTYDVLGIPRTQPFANRPGPEELSRQVSAALRGMVGKVTQEYPPYSSKTLGGEPLFSLARQGRLEGVEMPTKEVEIYEIRKRELAAHTPERLHAEIVAMIGKVKGDFRQEAILAAWDAYFRDCSEPFFYSIRFEASCSSGTYVRGIADALGKTLGTGAVALHIARTRVGKHAVDQSLR
jgi:tRNA pseudouridine55 synthase